MGQLGQGRMKGMEAWVQAEENLTGKKVRGVAILWSHLCKGRGCRRWHRR